jgi:hypothetical protein
MPKKAVSRKRNKTARLRAGLKAKSVKRKDRKAGLLQKRRAGGRLRR